MQTTIEATLEDTIASIKAIRQEAIDAIDRGRPLANFNTHDIRWVCNRALGLLRCVSIRDGSFECEQPDKLPSIKDATTQVLVSRE